MLRWLGLVEDEDEDLDVPEWLADYYGSEFDAEPVTDPQVLNGLLRLQSYLNHPSHWRRP